MLSIVNGSVGRGRCGSVFEPRNNAGLRHDCGCGRPPRRSGLHRGPAVRPPDTVVAMALADHAFKAGRQAGDDGVTI